jgi:hypothetical protein
MINMKKEKLIPLPKEEMLEFFKLIGINEDFVDLILVEDIAYDKQLQIFESRYDDVDDFVRRTNKMWDEVVEEKWLKEALQKI